MESIIFEYIEWTSLGVGILGIAVIVIGSLRGMTEYIFGCFRRDRYPHIRTTLGSHLILGLDFLVGKDVIDTILLDGGDEFWTDLAGLFTVVIIRITLTHFLSKELKEISNKEK